jgi:hypothetical protein
LLVTGWLFLAIGPVGLERGNGERMGGALGRWLGADWGVWVFFFLPFPFFPAFALAFAFALGG